MKSMCAFLMGLVLSACGSDEPVTQLSEPLQATAVPRQTQSETARLNLWLDDQFAEQLQFSPEFKSRLGDNSDNDKLDDRSEAAMDLELDWLRNSVATMRSEFAYDSLSDDGRLSFDLWEYSLELADRARPFRRHSYIFGRGGPQASLPNFLINFHPVASTADADAYIARLEQIERVFEQLLERAQAAAADGIRQPRFAYQFAIDEVNRVTAGAPFNDGEPSPIWVDFQSKVDGLVENSLIDQTAADELLARAREVLSGPVSAAYNDLATWLQQDIQQADDEANGVWNLPQGEAYYNQRLFQMTGMELTADEIHNIGLSEVARLQQEMEAVKRRVGFEGSLQDFFIYVRSGEQFYLPNTDAGRQAYLDMANDFLSAIEEKLPEYFGRLPKAALEVRRVEAFREQDGAAQHYSSGTPDGSRPGVFYSHLSDMNAMPTYQLEDVAYHEGSPGHHMQISIQQELTEIPRFRTQFFNTAYTEGWGLYAEALAKEMGFFQDPYSEFGRLTGEIWRAIRLVVDTGIHSKQWSQEQAVQYMLTNAPLAEGAVRSEIQRYITGPGQATAYKLGMLKFQELRERASTELGSDFDIREFHDVVLGSGALPMPILEAQIERWIQQQ